MDTTPNLDLPYIAAAQAQKHVTHNEAIRALDAIVQLSVADRDLDAPPISPDDGARFIVGSSPTGEWAGHAGEVAAWQDNAWLFYAPAEGWLAYVTDEAALVAFNGSSWLPVTSGGSSGGGGVGGGVASVNPTALVGVNATADAANRLSVSSPAVLLNHEGGDHRLKINKNTAGDTASLLFQSGFSGRAEIGLAGSDALKFKVSADGASWFDAMAVDNATGAVSFPNTQLAGAAPAAQPNLLINGDFQINQRDFAGGALSSGTLGHDRWRSAGATYSVSGFVVTLAAGAIEQVIEAQQWGLESFANAELTISLEDPSGDITVAAGAVSGTIPAGTGRQSVTLMMDATGGNRVISLASQSGGSVSFARVKVEAGSAATPWTSRDAGAELQLCQRYFYRRRKHSTWDALGFLSAFSGTGCWGTLFYLPVRMRSDTPSVTASAVSDLAAYTNTARAISAAPITSNGVAVQVRGTLVVTGASFAAGECVMIYFNNAGSGYLDVDAELSA
ncbi:MAG: DUF2793 domain-containing protein [Pseudomonadota bacterium]